MIGYKGFDKNMKCQAFQFEVGKTYEYTGEIKELKEGEVIPEYKQGE